jgi:hypothetical protein
VPSVFADPGGHVAQALRLEPARPPLSLASLLDQTGPLQHLEVFRDGRKTEIERGRQLRDRRLTLGQPGQDGSTGRIGEGRERGAQVVGLRLHFSLRLINLWA